MGILKRHISIMSIEQKKNWFNGDVLTLGQQVVYSTLDDVKVLLKQHDVPSKELPTYFDVANKIAFLERHRIWIEYQCTSLVYLARGK